MSLRPSVDPTAAPQRNPLSAVAGSLPLPVPMPHITFHARASSRSSATWPPLRPASAITACGHSAAFIRLPIRTLPMNPTDAWRGASRSACDAGAAWSGDAGTRCHVH